MPTALDPAERVVVVTGAGSGIGAALAAEAARRGARAVAVCDLDDAAAAQVAAELPGLARAYAFDVANENAVLAALDSIEAELGAVDVWCSNAGLRRGAGLGTDRDWSLSLSAHLRAHILVGRHVLPRMLERSRGWIEITASAAGLLSDLGSAPYTASKHAAVSLAEWLSIQHDGDGVTVSCLCPQGVATAMNSGRRDGATGSGTTFLSAATVAERTFDAMAEARFLILPHAEVAEYERRRTEDRERWLAGMRRLAAVLAPQSA